MRLLSIRGREAAAEAAAGAGAGAVGPSKAIDVPRPRDHDRYTSLMVRPHNTPYTTVSVDCTNLQTVQYW